MFIAQIIYLVAMSAIVLQGFASLGINIPLPF